MPTLAPKLPWLSPFAGGYPGRGGQYLPVDADATDYLSRLAEADGASVEVGIAQAIEAFIVGCKADSAGYAGDPTRTNWDAIQASCVMCGARTLSGALVPLKTPYGSELVNINALPTPSVDTTGSTGLVAAWNAATRTVSVTSAGSSSQRPVIVFPVGMVAGKRYRVTGRLSGDTSRAFSIGAGSGQNTSYNSSTGEFNGIVKASSTYFWMYVNGQQTCSVTIESLSIREDSFTPTPYNFASGDYSKSGTTPGIKGDGSTKYLNTNRGGNADGQDDAHLSVFITQGKTAATVRYAGWLDLAGGTRYTQLFSDSANTAGFVNSTTPTYAPTSSGINFFGISRGNPSSQDVRLNGASQSGASSSVASSGVNAFVFARSYGGSPDQYFDGRLAFYSVGAALDLAALDTRTTNLVNAIKFHTLTGLLPNDYDPDTIAYIVAAYEAGGTL